jgi:23S rRNA (cytosine1962-C5)-methyltransferase
VGVYIGRLARRGERFDAIILDPPTFGRGGGRRTFRIERDFAGLVRAAGEVSEDGGVILLSTNFRAWGTARLEGIGRANLPAGTVFECGPLQRDFLAGEGASSVWALLP